MSNLLAALVLIVSILLFGIISMEEATALLSSKTSSSISSSRRLLPKDKLLIGYGVNVPNVKKAVEDGVTVVIWAFMDIVTDDDDGDDTATTTTTTTTTDHRELQEVTTSTLSSTTTVRREQHKRQQRQEQQQRSGKIQTTLDIEEIQKLITELDHNGYDHVVHLVSFGGWNGGHLDPNLTAEEWYRTWKESIVCNIFHGIDWDLEGNDDITSPYNIFTIECLEKMGTISRLMKQDGYLVGMAPPQSYMNFDDPHFSRYVNLTEPDREWHSEFHYFGANVYSYLLTQKYGQYIDFCSMQLYESYSLAAMAVYHKQLSPEDYLVSYIQDLIVQQKSKFYVDFSNDKDLQTPSQYVHLPLSKLVIGLANGWAADPDNKKHIYISPDQIQKAYNRLKTSEYGDLTPRGFMFWTIEEEGTRDIHFARDVSMILKTSLA